MTAYEPKLSRWSRPTAAGQQVLASASKLPSRSRPRFKRARTAVTTCHDGSLITAGKAGKGKTGSVPHAWTRFSVTPFHNTFTTQQRLTAGRHGPGLQRMETYDEPTRAGLASDRRQETEDNDSSRERRPSCSLADWLIHMPPCLMGMSVLQSCLSMVTALVIIFCQ